MVWEQIHKRDFMVIPLMPTYAIQGLKILESVSVNKVAICTHLPLITNGIKKKILHL